MRVGLLLVAGCASAGAPAGGDDVDAAVADTNRPDGAPDGPASGCAARSSGVLATWTFSGEPGSQAATAPATTAQGVVATAIARSAALTATAGTNSMNASNWPSSSQRDATKYYTFSITPPAGCAMDLTGSSIDARSSSTGPTKAAIGTSADAYAATQTVSTTAASSPTLSVMSQSAMVELRVYGFSASGTAGTMRLQTSVTVSGAIH